MCWNSTTSLIAFITGTLINIYMFNKYKNNKTIIIICIAYEWALFMQLLEYFIWNDINCKTNTNKIASLLALFFNITQPIIVYILLMTNSNVSYILKVISTLLILFYTFYTLYYIFNNLSNYNCVTKRPNCSNINLKWWDDIKFGGTIFGITLFLIILLLLRPVQLSVPIVIYLIITSLISSKFYSCGTASIWCLLYVPLILFLLLYIPFLQSKNIKIT
jgi:hypothetical protein